MNKAVRVTFSILGGLILTIIVGAIVVAGLVFSVSIGVILVPLGLVGLVAAAIYFETEKPDS